VNGLVGFLVGLPWPVQGCGLLTVAFVVGVIVYSIDDQRRHSRAMAPVNRWLATGEAQPDAPSWLLASQPMPDRMRQGLGIPTPTSSTWTSTSSGDWLGGC
jgi:hypothetical protein